MKTTSTVQFDETESNCVACGSDRIKQWKSKATGQGRFDIWRCGTCGTGFLNPRPTLSWLISNIYTNSGHGLRTPPSYSDIIRAETEYPNSSVDAKELVKGTYSLFAAGSAMRQQRALDIGSGYGFYSLEVAQHGFDVTAINPANWENIIFRELLNGYTFDLIEGSFEDHDFEDKKFDLIIASQVLEHAHEPRSFVAKINNLLAPGGIFVAAVPSFDWILVKVLKERESGVLWVPEHLNYFTKAGLQDLVMACGLSIRRTSNFGRIPYNVLSRRLKWQGPKARLLNQFVRGAQWLPMRVTEVLGVSLMNRVWSQARSDINTNWHDRTS